MKYSNTILRILFVSAITVIAFTLHAKDDKINYINDTIDIKEVTVTGTKAAVLKNTIAQSVSVINEEEIRNSTETNILPILSNEVPGLHVSNFGVLGYGVGQKSTGQINMRGVGGKPTTQTLVLIDGHPQYMGIFGHPIPDAYVTSDISRVEIIRGPSSLLYGSNAMGGVINLITRDQQHDGPRIGAELSYGSFNTQKYMLNGGYKIDDFSVFAALSRNTTDGHLDSSGFERWNGNIKLGYEITDNWEASAGYNVTDFNYTFPPVNQDNAFISDINRGRASLSIKNEYDNTSGAFMAFYNYGEHDLSDGWFSNDRNAGAMLYQSYSPVEGNLFTVGLDYKNYGGKGSPVVDFQRDENGNIQMPPQIGMSAYNDAWTTINEFAGYVFASQRIFNSLSLNAGLRLENNSVYGTEWVPQAGLAYNLPTETTVKASFSKGFRNPTILELYMFPVSNEELLPERMNNYDLSFIQSVMNGKVNVELTGFYSEGDNIIQTSQNPSPPPMAIRKNSGNFENYGLESMVKISFSEHSRVNINYTYINSDNPILYTPENKLHASLNQQIIPGLSFNAGLEYVNGLYTRLSDEAAGISELKEEYLLLNAGLRYEAVKDYLDVYLKANNILGTNYQVVPGLDMPSTHFNLGLKFNMMNF